MIALPSTHVVCTRASDGRAWLDECRVGDDLAAAVDALWLCRTHALVAVILIHFDGRPPEDVTAAALHALAAECDTDGNEAPAGTLDAFRAHDVPAPVGWASLPWRDENAEHRIGPVAAGVMGRAA